MHLMLCHDVLGCYAYTDWLRDQGREQEADFLMEIFQQGESGYGGYVQSAPEGGGWGYGYGLIGGMGSGIGAGISASQDWGCGLGIDYGKLNGNGRGYGILNNLNGDGSGQGEVLGDPDSYGSRMQARCREN